MKNLLLAICLLVSVSAIAAESNTNIVCGPDEVVVQILVGRYCAYYNPVTYTCMDWENLYKERCEPKFALKK
jgi:hypothetical protein